MYTRQWQIGVSSIPLMYGHWIYNVGFRDTIQLTVPPPPPSPPPHLQHMKTTIPAHSALRMTEIPQKTVGVQPRGLMTTSRFSLPESVGMAKCRDNIIDVFIWIKFSSAGNGERRWLVRYCSLHLCCLIFSFFFF